MNTKYTYVLVAILATFALGAIAFAPAAEATNLSGAHTYTMYVEVVEPNGMVSDHVTVTFVSQPNNADFAEAATAAFAAKGIPLVVSESSYGITMSWDDGNLNIACWIANGDEWAVVEDTSYQYVESSVIGLAVGTGFISEEVYKALPASAQTKWVANEWGAGTEWAYMKCPDLCPSEVVGSCSSNAIGSLLCNVTTGNKAFA